MAKRELGVGPSLARIEALKEEYRAREREINQLEHEARKEKRVGRSTILGDCDPDCPACAELRELWDLGQRIRAVEKDLMAKAARSHILAAPKRAPGGAKAAQARSRDPVIEDAIQECLKAGKKPKVKRIQDVIEKRTLEKLESSKKWKEVKMLVDEDRQVAIEAEHNAGRAVKARREWVNVPSASTIGRYFRKNRSHLKV